MSSLPFLVVFSAASALAAVTVRHAQIFVDNAPFFVKGVAYSPVPISHSPVWHPPFGDYFTSQYADIWNRDFASIKSMGANVVRVYGWNNSQDHTAFFDTLHRFGLKAIVTFYMGTAASMPVDTEMHRRLIVKEFAGQVKRYLGHPAILGWTFGNEFNNNWQNFLYQIGQAFHCGWDPTSTPEGCWDSRGEMGTCAHSIPCVYRHLFGLLNNASIAAHAMMTPRRSHLIMASLADVDQMMLRVEKFGHYASDIDVWGLQIYRGRNFGEGETNILEAFPKISLKAYLITEFGVDAYRDPCGYCTASVRVLT